MLCRDGTCCRLLIIITRFIVLFIFPDSIACPCVRPYWWREVNIEQPYLAELAWAQRFHLSWYFKLQYGVIVYPCMYGHVDTIGGDLSLIMTFQ